MCEFKSGIIQKNRVVLAPEGNESHSDLLESLNIEDDTTNAKFVRVELIPPNGNRAAAIDTWRYNVDQDFLPEWYQNDPGRYEEEFRTTVKDWIEKNTVSVCNQLWTTVEKAGNTYYFLYGTLFDSRFGKNNNFAESDVREKLAQSVLLSELKKEFGCRLVPITTDLISMDGFKDYGVVEDEILAIPTVGLYMELGSEIPLIGEAWWLATPNQTPARRDTSYVRCVLSNGNVNYNDCDWNDYGVRPF